MVASTNCPSCGSAVEFGIGSSLVAVCESCQSLVGRGDGALENYGKVADISPTRTPLRVGLRGRHRGQEFEITGRTQLQHAAGGTWNEWYLAMRGGERWGWLAEAQGRLNLTFAQPPIKEGIPATVEGCELGDTISIPRAGMMTVVEVGEATVLAAEGELPFVPQLGAAVAYVDLQGKGGKFATIDYSESPPEVFGGREVTLESLGVADDPLVVEAGTRAGASTINCPSCAGPLTIQEPDAAQRVACQYCGAMHEVNDGKLEFLEALGDPKHTPGIPLGSTGVLDEIEFTVIGFLRRSMRDEGKTYPWTEYLLWSQGRPYYWLVESQKHWSLGTAISAGEVELTSSGLRCAGQRYRLFERYQGRTQTVIGEFYWKIERGETVECSDFIRPPMMISCEVSQSGSGKQPFGSAPPSLPLSQEWLSGAREIAYTQLEYIEAEVVKEAFDAKSPPFHRIGTYSNPGPNQPYRGAAIYVPWLVMMAVAVLLGVLGTVMGDKHTAGRLMWTWAALSAPAILALLGHWAMEAARWRDNANMPFWLQSDSS